MNSYRLFSEAHSNDTQPIVSIVIHDRGESGGGEMRGGLA
jgi:hypothetical protein